MYRRIALGLIVIIAIVPIKFSYNLQNSFGDFVFKSKISVVKTPVNLEISFYKLSLFNRKVYLRIESGKVKVGLIDFISFLYKNGAEKFTHLMFNIKSGEIKDFNIFFSHENITNFHLESIVPEDILNKLIKKNKHNILSISQIKIKNREFYSYGKSQFYFTLKKDTLNKEQYFFKCFYKGTKVALNFDKHLTGSGSAEIDNNKYILHMSIQDTIQYVNLFNDNTDLEYFYQKELKKVSARQKSRAVSMSLKSSIRVNLLNQIDQEYFVINYNARSKNINTALKALKVDFFNDLHGEKISLQIKNIGNTKPTLKCKAKGLKAEFEVGQDDKYKINGDIEITNKLYKLDIESISKNNNIIPTEGCIFFELADEDVYQSEVSVNIKVKDIGDKKLTETMPLRIQNILSDLDLENLVVNCNTNLNDIINIFNHKYKGQKVKIILKPEKSDIRIKSLSSLFELNKTQKKIDMPSRNILPIDGLDCIKDVSIEINLYHNILKCFVKSNICEVLSTIRMSKAKIDYKVIEKHTEIFLNHNKHLYGRFYSGIEGCELKNKPGIHDSEDKLKKLYQKETLKESDYIKRINKQSYKTAVKSIDDFKYSVQCKFKGNVFKLAVIDKYILNLFDRRSIVKGSFYIQNGKGSGFIDLYNAKVFYKPAGFYKDFSRKFNVCTDFELKDNDLDLTARLDGLALKSSKKNIKLSNNHIKRVVNTKGKSMQRSSKSNIGSKKAKKHLDFKCACKVKSNYLKGLMVKGSLFDERCMVNTKKTPGAKQKAIKFLVLYDFKRLLSIKLNTPEIDIKNISFNYKIDSYKLPKFKHKVDEKPNSNPRQMSYKWDIRIKSITKGLSNIKLKGIVSNQKIHASGSFKVGEKKVSIKSRNNTIFTSINIGDIFHVLNLKNPAEGSLHLSFDRKNLSLYIKDGYFDKINNNKWINLISNILFLLNVNKFFVKNTFNLNLNICFDKVSFSNDSRYIEFLSRYFKNNTQDLISFYISSFKFKTPNFKTVGSGYYCDRMLHLKCNSSFFFAFKFLKKIPFAGRLFKILFKSFINNSILRVSHCISGDISGPEITW